MQRFFIVQQRFNNICSSSESILKIANSYPTYHPQCMIISAFGQIILNQPFPDTVKLNLYSSLGIAGVVWNNFMTWTKLDPTTKNTNIPTM